MIIIIIIITATTTTIKIIKVMMIIIIIIIIKAITMINNVKGAIKHLIRKPQTCIFMAAATQVN